MRANTEREKDRQRVRERKETANTFCIRRPEIRAHACLVAGFTDCSVTTRVDLATTVGNHWRLALAEILKS